MQQLPSERKPTPLPLHGWVLSSYPSFLAGEVWVRWPARRAFGNHRRFSFVTNIFPWHRSGNDVLCSSLPAGTEVSPLPEMSSLLVKPNTLGKVVGFLFCSMWLTDLEV